MRGLAILALGLLAACQREPSFDERYGEAQETVQSRAAGIDSELHEGLAPAASPSPTPRP